MLADVMLPLKLTFRLWLRFWLWLWLWLRFRFRLRLRLRFWFWFGLPLSNERHFSTVTCFSQIVEEVLRIFENKLITSFIFQS